MKRLLFVVALMPVLLAGCSKKPVQNPYPKPDWFTNATYFEEKDGLYEELPVYANSIVMVGDDYIDRGLWSEFFGDTATESHNDALIHFRSGFEVFQIFLRTEQRKASGHSARDDGNVMDRVNILQVFTRDGMA